MNRLKKITIKYLSPLILGGSFGLFAYSYIGNGYILYGSKRLLVFSLLIGLLGSIAYYFIVRFILKQRAFLGRKAFFKLIILSSLITPILFFFSTIQWQRGDLFFYPLLPTSEFEITVAPQNPETDFSITWFSNSFGDISFESVEYQGWKRDGDMLRLANSAENSLFWRGKVGEHGALYFEATGNGQFYVRSNFDSVVIHEYSAGTNKYEIFGDVPWLASRAGVLVIGNINFFFGVFAFLLFFWPQRRRWISTFSQTLAGDRKHKINKIDLVWIFTLFLFSLSLRIFNLDALPPHIEEYRHLNAAKDIFNGVSWMDVYQRSFYVVTLPVYLFFALFGVKAGVARFVGVLFNSFAIIPLYLITRKIDRRLAIVASFLYATSPYIISLARNVREYAYYPFYFYLVAYISIEYLEKLYKRGVTLKFFLENKNLILLFLLLIPLIYVSFDRRSTLKILIICYGILALFILMKIRLNGKRAYFVFLVVFLVSLGAGFWFFVIQGNAKHGTFNNYLIPFSQGDFETPLNYFFYNPPQQWYFNRLALVPVTALFCTVFYGVLVRKNVVVSYFAFLYMVSLTSFLLFFGYDSGTRFYLHIQLWHIILIAMGGYGIMGVLSQNLNSKKILWTVSIILVLVTFNPSQVLLSQLHTRSGGMPISRQSHYNFDITQAYLLERVSPDDVLISYDYGRYAYFSGKPQFSAVYMDGGLEDLSKISMHDTGWIVINEKYYPNYSDVVPLGAFTMGDKEVFYLDEVVGDHVDHIWRWENSTE